MKYSLDNSQLKVVEKALQTHLQKEEVVLSQNELLKIDQLINPQFEKIISKLKNILKFEKICNILLLKLINGKIRII